MIKQGKRIDEYNDSELEELVNAVDARIIKGAIDEVIFQEFFNGLEDQWPGGLNGADTILELRFIQERREYRDKYEAIKKEHKDVTDKIKECDGNNGELNKLRLIRHDVELRFFQLKGYIV